VSCIHFWARNTTKVPFDSHRNRSFPFKSFVKCLRPRHVCVSLFFVLMRIFARDQRKYLLSTILKYERFPAACPSLRLRLRKQLEGTRTHGGKGCHSCNAGEKRPTAVVLLCTEEEVSRTTVEGTSNLEPRTPHHDTVPSMLSKQSSEQRTRPLALEGTNRRGKSLEGG